VRASKSLVLDVLGYKARTSSTLSGISGPGSRSQSGMRSIGDEFPVKCVNESILGGSERVADIVKGGRSIERWRKEGQRVEWGQ